TCYYVQTTTLDRIFPPFPAAIFIATAFVATSAVRWPIAALGQRPQVRLLVVGLQRVMVGRVPDHRAADRLLLRRKLFTGIQQLLAMHRDFRRAALTGLHGAGHFV